MLWGGGEEVGPLFAAPSRSAGRRIRSGDPRGGSGGGCRGQGRQHHRQRVEILSSFIVVGFEYVRYHLVQADLHLDIPERPHIRGQADRIVVHLYEVQAEAVECGYVRIDISDLEL